MRENQGREHKNVYARKARDSFHTVVKQKLCGRWKGYKSVCYRCEKGKGFFSHSDEN